GIEHDQANRFPARGVAGRGRAVVRRPLVQRADAAVADEGGGARVHGLRVCELRALARRRARRARHPRMVGGVEGRVARRPEGAGLVIAANHQTYLDPFWVSSAVKRPTRYLAWNEAFKWPLVGKALELLGAWPLVLDRGNPTAYRRSLQWLRAGGVVMIFPEGERAFADAKFARFKVGAARLALEADV